MSSLVVSSIANASGVSLVQPGFRNVLINAGFTINQRAYVSAATLAASAYGHDRFKAGASGGDYTFTQLNSTTQITIASGKSLIQVVEDKNVYGGSYVLSWTGTAQARVGVNSATPSGSYAASPILITGQTAGTTMSVEFNAGTLSAPQLELGTVRTSFEVRPYGTELVLCQRYYQNLIGTCGLTLSTIGCDFTILFPVVMRVSPTCTQAGVVTITDVTTSDFVQSAIGFSSISGPAELGHHIRLTNFSGLTPYRSMLWRNVSTATGLLYSAEL